MEGAWLLLTEPMFEFSRSARRQVEFDGRKLVSVVGGGCSKRSNFLYVFFFGGGGVPDVKTHLHRVLGCHVHDAFVK